MTSRGEFPPRRQPWAYDNGAFADWTNDRPFDSDRFIAEVARMEDRRPDFIALPDIVAGGERSLEFSLSWAPRLIGLTPLYLVVQDDMDPAEVAEVLPSLGGLFVGGTSRWKLRTGAVWVQLAHAYQRPCHIGRVGTEAKARPASAILAPATRSPEGWSRPP